MGDGADVDREIEPGKVLGVVLGRGERPDDVEQFFFGEADQRTTQQGPQGKRVTPIGEHARQGDQVLNFLPAKQAFSCLSGDWDAEALKRLFVTPYIAPGRCTQVNVASS